MAWIAYVTGVFFLGLGVEIQHGGGKGFIIVSVFAFFAAIILFVDKLIKRKRYPWP